MRGILKKFCSDGEGYSGWFCRGRELTDDEKLERFKTRVLHVSDVNKYHQIYDRGIALGPSRIQGLVELTTQVVQDLEVVIYRRKNQNN